MSGATRSPRLARPRLTLVWVAACALAVPLTHGIALATPVTTTANTPHAGISPGGVNMATGELILVMRPDLALDGPMPVTFGRYYGSMLVREGLAMGHLGPNWLGTYDWRIRFGATGPDVITDEGQDIQFQPLPGGSWGLVHPTDHAYVLTSAGTGLRFTDPVSRRVHVFDGDSGRLMQILDEHGNALTLTYVGGMLSQVSDGMGRGLTFGYDPLGMLSSVSDGTRNVSFNYQAGALAGVTDASGHPWTYAYAPESTFPALLAAVIEPLGNAPLTQSYDPLGRVASQQDAASGVATYAYDLPTGSVFTDPLSQTWTYMHDPLNQLVSVMGPQPLPWMYQYDVLGRLSSATRPLGDATTFEYDPASGYPSGVGFPDATSIHWSYSSHGVGGATFFDLASTQYPDLTSSSCVRDAAGNLTDFTDRGGFHWQATYNSRGQILTSTNPATGANTLTYDPQGRVATSSDPAGNVTTYGYDEFSRLTSMTHADLSMRAYAYDAMDRLTGETDERGKTWSSDLDANGRITTETDPLTHATHYAYDPLDRVTQVTDPLGHSTLYGYDAGGRLATSTDRTSHVTHFSYDAYGNLTGVTDPANATWGGALDPDLRRTSAADPLGHAYLFGHDFRDRVTQVTDPATAEFGYAYDAMGRLHTATAPLGHAQTFTYDARGLLTSSLNAASETQYARTALGEVGTLTDPNHNPWQRGFDTQGRLSGTSDPLSRSSGFAYDSRSRLSHMDLPVGSADLTYDPASRVMSVAFPSGPALGFAYDDANRLTSATGASFAYDEGGRMIGSNGLGIAYDNEGRITSETYGPGKVVSYTYDDRGLLSQVSDWLSGVTTFTYDAAHRLTGISRPNGTSTTFDYDAADRLINTVEINPGPIQLPISSIAITRDALGQVSSIQRSAPILPSVSNVGTMTLAYDAASQVTGLTWDGLGRLTGDGVRTFVWDGASRLTHYTAGRESPTFTYDAFGNVASRTEGTASEQYMWNLANGRHTLDVVVQGGLHTREYVHTPSGLLLYSIEGGGGGRHFYHYDENGNTMFLTNDAGAVIANYIYSPTGEVSGSGASANNPFTLGGAGGTLQLGTGLFADGSAVYDSKFGRQVSGGATSSGSVWAGTLMHELGHNLGLFHFGTGISTVYGPDITISVPRQFLYAPGASDAVAREQAGTSAHELGHTIGLNHGGSGPPSSPQGSEPCPWCQPVNRRPNHLSAMGYAYQAGIGGEGPKESVAITSIKLEYKGFPSEPRASGMGEVYGNDLLVSIGGSEPAGAADGDRDGLSDTWESSGSIDNFPNPVPLSPSVDINCDGSLSDGDRDPCPWCRLRQALLNRVPISSPQWSDFAGGIQNRPMLDGGKHVQYRYAVFGHLTTASDGGSSTWGTPGIIGGAHRLAPAQTDNPTSAPCLWCPR